MKNSRFVHKDKTVSGESVSRLPGDPALSFSHLLDPDEFLSLLDECEGFDSSQVMKCRVEHVRYRPGKSCTVLYEIDYRNDGESGTTSLYAKSLTPGSYRRAMHRAENMRFVSGAMLPAPLAVTSRCTVVYEFPNDARLPWLGLIADSDRFSREMETLAARALSRSTAAGAEAMNLRTIRYKPESRFVAKWESLWDDDRTGAVTSVPMVLRFDRRTNVESATEINRCLWMALSSNGDVGVPEPLFSSGDMGISGSEWIDGQKLTTLLKTRDRIQAVEKAARALATFHELDDNKLPRRPTAESAHKSIERSRQLQNCGGEVVERLDDVLRRLEAGSRQAAAGRLGVVHGDFHQGQIIFSGERAFIIDMDRAGIGETVTDVGNFVAQLALLGLRGKLDDPLALVSRFVEEYQRSSGTRLERKSVGYWAGVSLLELAVKEFRRLKPDWPDRVVAILDCCSSFVQS